jgi:hypothetical protein
MIVYKLLQTDTKNQFTDSRLHGIIIIYFETYAQHENIN